jgi:hypothetical protein
MNTFFILLDITLFFVLVKYLIDVQHMTIKLVKEKALVNEINEKDNKYLLIKGLY